MGTQLMAIAAEGIRQRHYLAPIEEQETAAEIPRPDDVPEAELPAQHSGFRVQGYGMRTWAICSRIDNSLFSGHSATWLGKPRNRIVY